MLAAVLFLPVRAGAVSARRAYAVDAVSGRVLYEKNPTERSLIASTTKIMTALIVCEQCNVLDRMRIPKEAVGIEGSSMYLKEGEILTLQELLYGLMLSSGNDAAVALAEKTAGVTELFVEQMNNRARELGMQDTHFVNCTGLPAEGHVTSAWDIAVMSRELIRRHPDIRRFTTIWMDTLRDGQFQLSNTNKLIRFYSGATGLKTGFTSGAGYCLSASAMRDGMELIAVVMGAETSQSRNAACKSLLDYGFANFAVVSPDLSDCDNQILVRLGKDAGVSAVPEADMALLIDKAQKSGVTSEVTLEPTVTAPVSRGQRLGTLTVKSGDLVLKEVPLVAAQEVERLSYGEIYRMVLMRAAMAKTNAE